MTDDALRAQVASLVAEGLGGDAIKTRLGRREHRVLELWAEERARLDGVLHSVSPTPANVVEVRDTYTFGPDHDLSRKPRWELVAAVVYGDTSAEARQRVKALYERQCGPRKCSRQLCRARNACRNTRRSNFRCDPSEHDDEPPALRSRGRP